MQGEDKQFMVLEMLFREGKTGFQDSFLPYAKLRFVVKNIFFLF